MIYVTFFCTVLLILCGFIIIPSKKKQHVEKRISSYLNGETAHLHAIELKGKQKSSPIKHLLKSVWGSGARVFRKKMSAGKVAKIELNLLQAGSPLQMSPFDFRLFQAASLIGLPLFYGLLGIVMGLSESKLFLFILFGLGFGLLVPTVTLNSRIKKRARQALKELPDFVDLLTVSLEAGLGFDSALGKVNEKQKGVLADEFYQCLDEIRLGKTRREGLTGIKRRLAVDEITTLINSIIRAEKLGVGMVQVLRIQSAEVREKRRQRAEEQAMKAPIKILFPLVLFIFPSLFIIILGPAAIQIMNAFR